MEEGRSKGWGFRIGGWGGHSRDGSYDSLRKEEVYTQSEKKKKTKMSKRKKCKWKTRTAFFIPVIILKVY
jgi:glucan 1,3-beta-glucosidase